MCRVQSRGVIPCRSERNVIDTKQKPVNGFGTRQRMRAYRRTVFVRRNKRTRTNAPGSRMLYVSPISFQANSKLLHMRPKRNYFHPRLLQAPVTSVLASVPLRGRDTRPFTDHGLKKCLPLFSVDIFLFFIQRTTIPSTSGFDLTV